MDWRLRGWALVVILLAVGCKERTTAVANAPKSWISLSHEERDARLFAAIGDEPRRLHLGRSVVRFIDVGPMRTPPLEGPDEAKSPDSPWLLVHGFGGSMGDFAPIVVPLAKTRRVLALDLPGFGDSSTDEDDCTVDFLADTVESFARAVEAGPVNLVCHSLGGQVCLALAIRHAKAVASLTLIDAAGVQEKSSFVERVSKRFAKVNIGDVVTDPGRSAVDVPEGDQAIFRRLVSDDRALLTSLESFRANYRGRVGTIDVPTRIIWGSDDPIFSIDSAFYLAENIPGAALYVADGAGHSPQLTHPKAVLQWLGAIDKSENGVGALVGADGGK